MSTRLQTLKNHSEQLLSKMSELRDSQTLTDVSLKVGGKIFDAHRVVLAASSEYFCAMFTAGMRESFKKEIELKDDYVSPEALEIILNFVYGSELGVTEEKVFEVLGAADHLQMTSVIERCSEFISEVMVRDQLSKLDIQCLQKVLNIAERHSLLDLQDEVFHKMALVFKDASESAEFLDHMDANILLSLLQRNDLTAPSETFVFRAVITWIYHNKEERLCHAASLIRAVRLGLVEIRVLITELRRPELQGIEECRDILLDVSLYKHMPSLLPELSLVKTEPRTTASVLIAVRQKASLRFYDNTWKKWLKFGEVVPINEECRAVLSVGNYIYVGGNQRVYQYNIDGRAWDQLPVMKNSKGGRYHLLVLGDYLYAIGSNPERYSFTDKTWQPISTNPIIDNNVAAAVLGDCIYAVNCASYTESTQVLCFSPSQNQWVEKSGAISRRRFGCAFVYSDKLIITGGETHSGDPRMYWCHSKTVEVYSKENDRWSEVQQKRIAPADSSFAFEAENRIFIKLNNFAFDSGINLSSDEVYPVNLDKWRNVAAISSGSFITYAPVNINKLFGDKKE